MGANMNKKGFLLATSAGFAFAPMAHAADLRMPLKAPPPPPPAPTWAGFYIGGHIGTVWQQAQNTFNGGAPYSSGAPTSFFLPFSTTPTTSRTGLIGGGQIGYNWQYGSYVFGIEADGSGLSGNGTSTTGSTVWPYTAMLGPSRPYNGTTTISDRIRWLSTVRTRSGLAFGDTMAYVTGGVAFGGVRNSAAFTSSAFDSTHTYSAAVSQSKTRVGWTVGFGVEHMWDQHFTIAAEGLFVDLGNNNSTIFGRSAPPFSGAPSFKTSPISLKSTNQAVIGRLKLNYKF
jgi:outer membrane immunogenic protein